MKRLLITGATGSIGTNCIDVVLSHPDRFAVHALIANRSWERLAEQAAQVQPVEIVIADPEVRDEVDLSRFPETTRVRFGSEAAEELASASEVDCVVSAVVGAAGLKTTYAAVRAGKQVALANKESLVVAGGLIAAEAARTGATLLPVDSEHSAIFQSLLAGERREVTKIVLTASGGPFRTLPADEFAAITPERALKHPTWEMGPKITIDSATMMNKALEVIEAKWLFGLEASQIEVVVHPQSIIHSFVEFCDRSVICQLSIPDMRLPIQYALTYPHRAPGVSPAMNWSEAMTLEFEPPDFDRFPALRLGFEVAERGGTTGAVLNAANEAAVARFLAGSLQFAQIPEACREMLSHHTYDPQPSVSELLKLDTWVREEMTRWRP